MALPRGNWAPSCLLFVCLSVWDLLRNCWTDLAEITASSILMEIAQGGSRQGSRKMYHVGHIVSVLHWPICSLFLFLVFLFSFYQCTLLYHELYFMSSDISVIGSRFSLFTACMTRRYCGVTDVVSSLVVGWSRRRIATKRLLFCEQDNSGAR